MHVAGQGGEGGKVQCLWSGCKVYGALSSSTTWLTSHVTGHIGSKPFRCIVDACRQRFASQVGKSGKSIFFVPYKYLHTVGSVRVPVSFCRILSALEAHGPWSPDQIYEMFF